MKKGTIIGLVAAGIGLLVGGAVAIAKGKKNEYFEMPVSSDEVDFDYSEVTEIEE